MALAWDRDFYGLVAGYDTTIDSGHRVGVFAGVYGQYAMGNLTLDGSVALGYARHDRSRFVLDNLAGYETAEGDYTSLFVSPALSLTWSRPLGGGMEFRPSAQITYTHGQYRSYSESGTTNSDAAFGKRDVSILDARLQLALAKAFAGERGEMEWRAGATFTRYGGDNVDVRVGDARIAYRVPGDETLPGGFVGLNLRYAVSDRLSLGGDVEYARTTGDKSGLLSGQLGLAFAF